jgi:hypothetical protein
MHSSQSSVRLAIPAIKFDPFSTPMKGFKTLVIESFIQEQLWGKDPDPRLRLEGSGVHLNGAGVSCHAHCGRVWQEHIRVALPQVVVD